MARSMYVMLCNSAATAELYCGFIACLISSFVIVDRDIIEQSLNGCCCGRAAADGSTHVLTMMTKSLIMSIYTVNSRTIYKLRLAHA